MFDFDTVRSSSLQTYRQTDSDEALELSRTKF